MTSSNRPYIKPEHESNVTSHKYVSSVASIYYKLVQSPLCDWIVTKLPRSLAPNVITFTGFMCNVTCMLIGYYYYGDSTEGPVDDWFSLLLCISYFIYATLDNCDGKQARRVGAGNPMG